MNDPAWWQVVGFPAMGTALLAAWPIYQWFITRKDAAAAKVAERSMTASDREAARLVTEREALSKEQREVFERVEAERDRAVAEAKRERDRRVELERDRDRGWDLARWWNRRAHELRHAGLNAQTAVTGLCARDPDNLKVPTWPDMTLPGLEDPK